MRRRVLTIRTDYVTTNEIRCGEYNFLGPKTVRVASILIERDYVEAGPAVFLHGNNFDRGAAELHLCFCTVIQMVGEMSVTFRPRDQRLRFKIGFVYSGAEVEETRPGTRLIERHAVIVAAGIINPPMK